MSLKINIESNNEGLKVEIRRFSLRLNGLVRVILLGNLDWIV